MSICAALDIIADDGVVSRNGPSALGQVRDEAIRLRRLLADVPSMSRTVAARTSVNLLRTGKTPEWGRALELSSGVLWPDAGLNLGEDDHAVEIAIASSRVWELILLAVFRAAGLNVFDGNSAAMTPYTVRRPWVGLGVQPPRPDLLVGSGNSWYVVDAKYKDLSGTPAIDDLYQMFAYSHLGALEIEGAVDRFGLVYPTRDATSLKGPVVYPRTPDAAVGLGVHQLRFPSMRECRREWKSYLSEQSHRALINQVRRATVNA